jgi:hypothetical protein
MRSDPMCNSRPVFIHDMEQWGVEDFFVTSKLTSQYFEDIFERTYAWPHFIDHRTFRDYGETKTSAVLLSGGTGSARVWRHKVDPILQRSFVTTCLPHLGHVKGKRTSRMVIGEEYARWLNRAWFSVTDGTIRGHLVKKHFEIPGSHCILVTDYIPVLENAGFQDMKNCLFVDENNVVEKIDYLLDNVDLLKTVAKNGYDLVQSRHTLRHRPQIWEWFNLNKYLQAGQKIVQVGLFDSLQAVDRNSHIDNFRLKANVLDQKLLKEGDRLLLDKKFNEAISIYKKCLYFCDYMPEAQLRIGLCLLHMGKAKEALSYISRPRIWREKVLGIAAIDPIEQAYLVLAVICLGKMSEAILLSEEIRKFSNPESMLVYRLSQLLQENAQKTGETYNNPAKFWPSVHNTPYQEINLWFFAVIDILSANKQDEVKKMALEHSNIFKTSYQTIF